MSRVVVVGAGIGGLTAAHAIARAGHEPLVLEARAEPTEVGAGLALWPRPVQALRALGLGDALAATGTEARSMEIESASGRRLGGFDLAALERVGGAPMTLVERPALYRALSEGIEIRASARVVAVDGGGVALEGGERVDADAVVGADGVGSVVRAHVAPGDHLHATGRFAVRGTGPGGVDPGRAYEAWGAGELFGAVGLSAGTSYWFYETTGPIDPASLAERVRGWPERYGACVAATDPAAMLVHEIATVRELDRWTAGTVTLLGDAAHAMEPNLGQGAGQAIEDAAALGDALRDHADLAAALAAYPEARRRRAHRLQAESKRAADVALAARGSRVRDLAMRLAPDGLRQRVTIRRVV